MPQGKRPRRGEIWWGNTPGRPTDPHQPRPMLIISVDARNHAVGHYLVIPIFTTARLGPTRVDLPKGMGGLSNDSVAVCDEISVVEDEFLDFDGGPLGSPVSALHLERIVTALHHAVNP